MVVTRSGEYRSDRASSKRGRGQSQISEGRGRSPDHNGSSGLVQSVSPATRTESTLTLLSSLHRRESADNQCYMNVKRDKEYEVPPRYLEAVISLFLLIKTFLSWKEVISRLDGWNLYKERTMANTLAEIAKEKADLPKGVKSQLNYTRAKTPPKKNPTSMKEHLRR
ncbi:hypothetical protein VP01_831g1 [Puccinia sorghi]|uniref:Uncharacterized protein n=1 Tax=Puccinia sorghi TaxID=27349 RepID=A0A0L6UBS3_9BASI|nr:hypothetical protein VP01_831g1 [Puccinia sorghi]